MRFVFLHVICHLVVPDVFYLRSLLGDLGVVPQVVPEVFCLKSLLGDLGMVPQVLPDVFYLRPLASDLEKVCEGEVSTFVLVPSNGRACSTSGLLVAPRLA